MTISRFHPSPKLPLPPQNRQPDPPGQGYWEGDLYVLPKSEIVVDDGGGVYGARYYGVDQTEAMAFGVAGAAFGGVVGAAANALLQGSGLGWIGAAIGGLTGIGLAALNSKVHGHLVLTGVQGNG